MSKRPNRPASKTMTNKNFDKLKTMAPPKQKQSLFNMYLADLPKDFFEKILLLEMEITNNFDIDSLNELIQLYSTAIEFYMDNEPMKAKSYQNRMEYLLTDKDILLRLAMNKSSSEKKPEKILTSSQKKKKNKQLSIVKKVNFELEMNDDIKEISAKKTQFYSSLNKKSKESVKEMLDNELNKQSSNWKKKLMMKKSLKRSRDAFSELSDRGHEKIESRLGTLHRRRKDSKSGLGDTNDVGVVSKFSDDENGKVIRNEELTEDKEVELEQILVIREEKEEEERISRESRGRKMSGKSEKNVEKEVDKDMLKEEENIDKSNNKENAEAMNEVKKNIEDNDIESGDKNMEINSFVNSEKDNNNNNNNNEVNQKRSELNLTTSLQEKQNHDRNIVDKNNANSVSFSNDIRHDPTTKVSFPFQEELRKIEIDKEILSQIEEKINVFENAMSGNKESEINTSSEVNSNGNISNNNKEKGENNTENDGSDGSVETDYQINVEEIPVKFQGTYYEIEEKINGYINEFNSYYSKNIFQSFSDELKKLYEEKYKQYIDIKNYYYSNIKDTEYQLDKSEITEAEKITLELNLENLKEQQQNEIDKIEDNYNELIKNKIQEFKLNSFKNDSGVQLIEEQLKLDIYAIINDAFI